MSAEHEFGRPPFPLLCGEDVFLRIVAENGVQLAGSVDKLAREWSGGQCRFTPDLIKKCNAISLNGIYSCAGEWRDRFVDVDDFIPPPWKDIPDLVDEMCVYANSITDDPLHLSAYILWRVNWIHPFYDGNGRVSRELSYLALLVGNHLNELPGSPTIPELLGTKFKEEYIAGLQQADKAWSANDEVDVRKLEYLLSDALVEQVGGNS